MKLTVFQRLVLIALAQLIESIAKRPALTDLIASIAWGNYTEDQGKDMLAGWRRGDG